MYCDNYGCSTNSAERLRDLDRYINKTLSINDPAMNKILTLSILEIYWWQNWSK